MTCSVPGRRQFLSVIAILFVISWSVAPALSQGTTTGASGLPVPRFVSLKSDRVNVRVGPSRERAVAWTFVQSGLPVEIIQEFENWRRIRDWEGKVGWVFHSLLSGRRTALVTPWEKTSRTPLRARSKSDADKVVSDIEALGRKACALHADLTNEADMQALLPHAAEVLGGPLDVLVNNASIFEYDNIGTATRESWDRHIESNLRAPVVLTQAFAAQAPKAQNDAQGEPVATGLVVNMLDQRIRKLTPEFTSYTIAKMGLWAFTRTAAQSLAPAVRVNAIGPGPTMRGGRQTEEHFARQRAATVLERGSDPEDICAALAYLLRAKAVTGQVICVDGGQHLAWQTPDILGLE